MSIQTVITWWLPLLNTIIAALNIVIVPILIWLVKVVRFDLRRGLASQSALDKTDIRVTKLKERMALVERDIEHGALDELRESVAALAAQAQTNAKQLELLQAGVARVEDYLLNGRRA